MGASTNVLAQQTLDHPVGKRVPWHADSGLVGNDGAVAAEAASFVVRVPGATWIRVHFSHAVLQHGSAVHVTSLSDGETQVLDAQAMSHWSNSSAYFNGNEVEVRLIAGPGTSDNRLGIDSITAQIAVVEAPAGGPGECGICANDSRTLSSEMWSARLMPVGCTASVYCNTGSGLVTAGHCLSGQSGLVAQFNVPASRPNCNTSQPPVADQFPVTPGAAYVDGGVGNDFGVLLVARNSLGQTPYERYGQYRELATSVAAVAAPSLVYGYGVDATCERSQVQQRSSGSIIARGSSTYSFDSDITGGNSGSALLVDGRIVGVVTHCTQEDCNNLATRIDLPAFVAARNMLNLNCIGTPPPPPINDACAAALPLSLGVVHGSTAVASGDGSSVCDSSVSPPDAWYRFVAPCTGVATFNTLGSAFDTILSVHSGCPNAGGSEIACNDDTSGVTSVVSLPVQRDDVYLIRIAGYNGQVGTYQISAACAASGYCVPCLADFNFDGGVDGEDVAEFMRQWEGGDPCADANVDGGIDGSDVGAFFQLWEAGGCVVPCLPPTAPTNCVATRQTPCTLSVLVTWTASVGPNISGYVIWREDPDGTFDAIGVAPASATSFIDNRFLEAGERYWYTVTAFALGDPGCGPSFSLPSNWDDSIPRLHEAIAAPTNCIAERDDATPCLDVMIRWQDNSNNETGFNIARSLDGVNFDQVGEVGANQTVFRDSQNLTNDQTYHYHVRAKSEVSCGRFFSGYSNTERGNPIYPNVAAPSGLVAERDTSSPCVLAVNVRWQDNSGNETGFNVARSLDDQNWTQIGEVGANVTSFRDVSGLQEGVRYYYHVRAKLDATPICPIIYSGYSNSNDSIPRLFGNIAAPTNCTAARDDSTPCLDVIVRWTDNANNETGYNIARRTSTSDWTQIAEVGANVTEYRDQSLSLIDGERYYYHLRAKAVTGCGTFFSEYAESDGSIPRLPSLASGPNPFHADRHNPTPQADVRVYWTNTIPFATGLRIARNEVNPNNEQAWDHVRTAAFGDTEWIDTGVVRGRTYWYRSRYEWRFTCQGQNFVVYSPYSPIDQAQP